MPIVSRIAPVVPRVVVDGAEIDLTVEDYVRPFADAGARGVIAIVGEFGSGKSTALAHLAAALGPAVPVEYRDEDEIVPLEQEARSRLIVYVAERPRVCLYPHLRVARMKPWGTDEAIEYLLATRPDRCASVVARLGGAGASRLPVEIFRRVIDRLAADDALPDVAAAVDAVFGDADAAGPEGAAALDVALGRLWPREAAERLRRIGCAEDGARLVEHRVACLAWAARRIALDLAAGGPVTAFARRLPAELIAILGRRLATDARAREELLAVFAGRKFRPASGRPEDMTAAMAASVLHAAGEPIEPRADGQEFLDEALLPRISWRNAWLVGARLCEADLRGADLSGAALADAGLNLARLRGARFDGAVFTRAQFGSADLGGATFENASGHLASFESADLSGARCDGVALVNANFSGADLTRASFVGANLRDCRFEGARLSGADFSRARLDGARLMRLRLRDVRFDGARLAGARFDGSDLEWVRWPAAQLASASFRDAVLTGSRMPGAILTRANLVGAGLADVSWERADLRDADFSHASFQMGSSRSGLVSSPIACEGSRTGFYTDESLEQHYRSPEEIRKADLRGADLRGAIVTDADFYLVDLRGAIYTADQAEHFERCGAILETASGKRAG